MTPPKRRGVPLSVRLSPVIHAEIVARAKAEDKSVTQMVEILLRHAILLDGLAKVAE